MCMCILYSFSLPACLCQSFDEITLQNLDLIVYCSNFYLHHKDFSFLPFESCCQVVKVSPTSEVHPSFIKRSLLCKFLEHLLFNQTLWRYIFYCIVVINFGRLRSAAAGLLLVHLDHIVLLHLQRLRGLVIVDPPAIEQEPGGKDENEMMAAHFMAYFHWRLFM